MRRIVPICCSFALSLLAIADARAQAGQANPTGLNNRQDSAGQVVVQSSPPPKSASQYSGPVDILSDTLGVDFRPYLQSSVLPTVRRNWYSLIPESAIQKKGKVAIEFALTKVGKVAGMKLVTSSGDVTLDRAAWGGIIASDPFPSLPVEFKGEYLALRFRFFYNPDAADIAEEHLTPPSPYPEHKPIPAYNPAPADLADTRPNPLTAPDPKTSFMPAVLMGYYARSMNPKYPKRALGAKIEGVVRLDAEIDSDGKVRNVKVLEGNPMLAEASAHAVRKWRFYAAQKEDKPSEDVVHIKVEFRLKAQQVQAEVVSPEAPHAESPH